VTRRAVAGKRALRRRRHLGLSDSIRASGGLLPPCWARAFGRWPGNLWGRSAAQVAQSGGRHRSDTGHQAPKQRWVVFSLARDDLSVSGTGSWKTLMLKRAVVPPDRLNAGGLCSADAYGLGRSTYPGQHRVPPSGMAMGLQEVCAS
jgi:hypothetical protein